MHILRRTIFVAGGIIIVAITWFVVRSIVNQWSHDELVVSMETTRITSPLDELGYPDYVAALNERTSAGVTPDNNAAVLLLKAFGPAEVSPEIRAEFFDLLDMEPLQDEGDYFESGTDYARRMFEVEQPDASEVGDPDPEQEFEEQREKASERPWTREEYPHVAKWLDANDRHLETCVEASRCPRLYTPYVRAHQSQQLGSIFYPLVIPLRQAAQALATRAMLRLGEGNLEAAREDLLACRRLGRLASQGQNLVEGLVGIAIDAVAHHGEVQLLAANPSAEQCQRWWKQLQELQAMPALADKIDVGDRFTFLDAICNAAKYGPDYLSREDNHDAGEPALATTMVDWNVPLRMANEWLDRCIEAARIEDPAERASALAAFEAELTEMTGSIKRPESLVKAFFSRRAASEKIAQVMVGLMVPALDVALAAEWRNKTQESMIHVALAAAQFKSDHGAYPDALDKLVPQYLSKVPSDSFAHRPFVYKRDENGYRLYSFGKNGLDDGGKTVEDEGDFDDLVIEIPPPRRGGEVGEVSEGAEE